MKEIKFKKATGILAIAALSSYIDSLDDDKEYLLTVKENRRRRSLDANAYAWVLLDKLSEHMQMPKEDIYKAYIREIGGNCEIVCVKSEAVESLCNGWQHNGLGWQTDTMKSKLDGCTNVVLYYGSSVYDSAQMSRLIDMIVQDCKTFGIETLEDIELNRLVEAWGDSDA